jgi:hypothetical protein
MESTEYRLEAFCRVWDALSQGGHCDSLYGGEFWRVVAQWIDLGFPSELIHFIRRHANRPPMQRGG